MAEDNSSSSGGSIFSLNTLLAVVTLVGGFLLVSHRLSSDRPRRMASEGTRPLGLQNIDSRLWEDPFAAWDKLSEDERKHRSEAGLTDLARALTNGLTALDSSNLLVLGTMVSG